MFRDIYDYFVYKGIYALVISEHYDESFCVLNTFIVFNKTILELAESIIDYLLPVMDDAIESNCIKIIEYYRNKEYSDTQEKEEIYNICNSLIIKINSREKKEKEINKQRRKYIIDEYVYRKFPISGTLMRGIIKNTNDYFKLVKEFIFGDFKILVYNTKLIDDETYYEYLPEIYKNNPFFINSILYMIQDCNVILQDTTFKDRVRLDLAVIKTYIDDDSELNKKEHKSIIKQYNLCNSYFTNTEGK